MKCPKCGFIQPEEEFCAECGAHIPALLKVRRRKQLFFSILTAFLVVAGMAGLLIWFDQTHRGSSEGLSPQENRSYIPKLGPPPPPPPKPSQVPKKGKSHSGAQGQLEPQKTPSTGSETQTGGKESHREIDPEAQLKRWAAQEWVERAKDSGGDKEMEVEMYRQAIEVDPNFAPAHYHLGLLFWREGELEAAREAFSKFLELATPEERETFTLPEALPQDNLLLGAGSGRSQ